tara:strand:- start:992 stop:1309 length:318 start_codon:yes stop_codon:yes gene_type:complete
MSQEKKILFTDTDKRHANLKLRLHYDGLTQADFFRSLITGYLEKDENIMNFIAGVQESKNIHSKQKRAKSKKLEEEGENLMKKLGLGEEEIENIFDLLEEEHPNL